MTESSFVHRWVESHGNLVRTSWDALVHVPGGRAVFSELIGRAAPYTGTVGARVLELREGYARVVLPDRRAVRNHLGCVHAIALANLAELTGNVALAYALPGDARFIVAGLAIEYLKKARGTITGECHAPVVRSPARVEHAVDVTMRDPAGDVVARAVLRTLVGPKRV